MGGRRRDNQLWLIKPAPPIALAPMKSRRLIVLFLVIDSSLFVSILVKSARERWTDDRLCSCSLLQ